MRTYPRVPHGGNKSLYSRSCLKTRKSSGALCATFRTFLLTGGAARRETSMHLARKGALLLLANRKYFLREQCETKRPNCFLPTWRVGHLSNCRGSPCCQLPSGLNFRHPRESRASYPFSMAFQPFSMKACLATAALSTDSWNTSWPSWSSTEKAWIRTPFCQRAEAISLRSAVRSAIRSSNCFSCGTTSITPLKDGSYRFVRSILGLLREGTSKMQST